MTKREESSTPTVKRLMEMIDDLTQQNEDVILRVGEYQRQLENEASRHILEESVRTLQRNRGHPEHDQGTNF